MKIENNEVDQYYYYIRDGRWKRILKNSERLDNIQKKYALYSKMN